MFFCQEQHKLIQSALPVTSFRSPALVPQIILYVHEMREKKTDRGGNFQRWVTFRGPFCLFFFQLASWARRRLNQSVWNSAHNLFSFWSLWIKRLGSWEHFNNSIHQGVSLRRFICQRVESMGSFVFFFKELWLLAEAQRNIEQIYMSRTRL